MRRRANEKPLNKGKDPGGTLDSFRNGATQLAWGVNSGDIAEERGIPNYLLQKGMKARFFDHNTMKSFATLRTLST